MSTALDHSVREGYLSATHRSILLVDADVEALLARLQTYEPPPLPKWIDEGSS